VDWVFEAAPERLELKQQVFARLDALTGPDVVLASNSSVVRVGDVAAQATGRNRIVGTHRWNPPYLIPLVEVVHGEDTDPEVVRRTFAGVSSTNRPTGPALDDTVAWIECRLRDEHDAGDRTIVVADVLAVEASPDRGPLAFFRPIWHLLGAGGVAIVERQDGLPLVLAVPESMIPFRAALAGEAGAQAALVACRTDALGARN
jgi:hypothetical protein